jgi:5-methylcytosine-specific restriction enzyme subunit McrC
MQTDIMLSYGNKVLIIDAKYYSHTTQSQYDIHTLHSANLYQIFTYVKNKQAELTVASDEVSGMLLYAQTDEGVQLNNRYWMSKNKISVWTLNLDQNFSEISAQLDAIIYKHFGTLVQKRTAHFLESM